MAFLNIAETYYPLLGKLSPIKHIISYRVYYSLPDMTSPTRHIIYNWAYHLQSSISSPTKHPLLLYMHVIPQQACHHLHISSLVHLITCASYYLRLLSPIHLIIYRTCYCIRDVSPWACHPPPGMSFFIGYIIPLVVLFHNIDILLDQIGGVTYKSCIWWHLTNFM